ncbi:MAG TPA: M67 family metallopeptidase [Rhizomicrobium sp.]|jgi:proteasome lid subunit RPN8/RPN11|nr:M67 family metallopeptidase [Rhizomicrobium sp.]
MIDVLELAESLCEQLKREAQSTFPRECCGLVEGICEGSTARATALHPMPNAATAPDRFDIDPSAHIALLRHLRGTGRQIIGCYHSHPNGRPEPSTRDLAGASEAGFLWLIAAIESPAADPRLACFVWTGTGFAPVQLVNFPLPHERGGEG